MFVTGTKIIKIDDKIISLNLNPKHKTKEPRKEYKMCKTKVQTNFYCDKIKNVNMKRTKRGYGVKSYLRLVLNILKVMGFYFYLYPFGTLAQRHFYGSFHVPID